MGTGLHAGAIGQVASPAALRAQRDRWFFSGMAVLAAAVVFAGFAPSYYLKTVYGTPVLSPLLHLHGAVFTSWILLLMVQTTLVAAGRTPVHRRLGAVGGALAVVMTGLAFIVAVDGARRGAAQPEALSFLAVPLATVLVFPALVGASLYWRRQPDAHKRLMILATTELLAAGVGRIPFIGAWGPWAFFAGTDLFVAALWGYDLLTRGRLHPASLWGGVFLVSSQVIRVAGSGTESWLAFARWITG